MILCTCDHCGKRLRLGHALNLREDKRPEYGTDGSVVYERWGDPVTGDFCDLPCLTGWAMAQAHKFGFHNRIPQAKQ